MKILRRSFFSLVVAALTLATLALVAHSRQGILPAPVRFGSLV